MLDYKLYEMRMILTKELSKSPKKEKATPNIILFSFIYVDMNA